jgi:cytochrome P450
MTADATIPDFPMRRESPFDPPPQIMQFLADRPVAKVRLWNGQEPWLVTRYDDVKQVLQSKAFSSDVRAPGYPKVSASLAAFTEGLLNHMDPPEHDAYRRMLAPEFMVKRIERLRPEVRRMVDDLIDAMVEQGSPADLFAAFAFPLPAQVTCAMLGIPFDDQAFFVRCAETFLGGIASAEETGAAQKDLYEYLRKLIDEKSQNPTDDVLGYMASEHVKSGGLSAEALVTIAMLILIAGFDTTANMITLGLLTLMQHPDQMDVLKREPELIPGAAEELLRFLTVTHRGRHKAALEDITVGGQLIRAGEGVIAAQDSANRDPQVFADPNVLDVRREARNHLAFGHGVHQCLGAALARIELQEAYGSVLRRLPDIRLAVPLDEIDFKHEAAVYGVRSMPVAW